MALRTGRLLQNQNLNAHANGIWFFWFKFLPSFTGFLVVFSFYCA